MSTVAEQFQAAEDFELLLDTAMDRVRGAKEEDFVAGLQDKFRTYGDKMFLSEPQSRWLCQIAGR